MDRSHLLLSIISYFKLLLGQIKSKIFLLNRLIVIGDNTPPSMNAVCLSDIHQPADKYQISTIVTWPENDAMDDRDGPVR